MSPDSGRTAVIALGGNALAPSGGESSITDQFRHTRESLGPVVDLALDGWHLCLVVADRLMDGHPVGPIRGRDAMDHGWEALRDAYAERLGLPATD